MKSLEVRRLGRCEYQATVRLQEELVARRRAGEVGNLLLLLEHEPVITVGRTARSEATPAPVCGEIPIVETSRGGQATYHGPGQLVIYPILDLRQWQRDLHWYLRALEAVVIQAVEELGLPAGRCEGFTGVWTSGKKIASIGVAVRGWITYHGVALNVDVDLRPFSLMAPCGLPAEVMSSLSQMGLPVTVEQVMPAVEKAFREVFGL